MEREVKEKCATEETLKKIIDNSMDTSNSSSDLEEDIIEGLDVNRRNSFKQNSNTYQFKLRP